jgi:hypothetical protein
VFLHLAVWFLFASRFHSSHSLCPIFSPRRNETSSSPFHPPPSPSHISIVISPTFPSITMSPWKYYRKYRSRHALNYETHQQPRPYNNPNYLPNGAATLPPGAAPLLPNQGRVIQTGPIRVLCIADVRGMQISSFPLIISRLGHLCALRKKKLRRSRLTTV